MSEKRIGFIAVTLVLAWLVFCFLFDSWGPKLGLPQEYARLLLYVMPFVAAFLVSYFFAPSARWKAFLLVVPIVVLGPLANFALSEFGFGSDFPGLAGIEATFLIFLVIALVTVVPGLIVGTLAAKFFRTSK